jgi:hypothetical protein
VLAFLSVQAIFARGGLNTASWLLSTLISRHHPAIKRLFGKGPRIIGEKLNIEAAPTSSKTAADCLYVSIGDEAETIVWPRRYSPISWEELNDLPLPKGLPLPVVPANQDILGLGSVSLILSPGSSHMFNHEV